MDKYICEPCGYIYDPAAGDPDSGIAPGTPFEDLPDDWVCTSMWVSSRGMDAASGKTCSQRPRNNLIPAAVRRFVFPRRTPCRARCGVGLFKKENPR